MTSLRLLVGVVLFVLPVFAQAEKISIHSVTPSSTCCSYDVNNLINDAGLVGDIHRGGWEFKWRTDSTPTGTLVFDLGAVYDVTSTSVWNYGGGCCDPRVSTRGLGIDVSLDGISYTPVGSFVVDQPLGSIDVQEIELVARARFIRFNLNSNYDGPAIGLSEVQFFGAQYHLDTDADGINDSLDNCLSIPNPDQANSDGAEDGGDACDTDDDNDTWEDEYDNCPTIPNPDQLDSNNNGIGDLCDIPGCG